MLTKKKKSKDELRFVFESSIFFEDVRNGKVVERVEIDKLPPYLSEYRKFSGNQILKDLVRIVEKELERCAKL